jgi:hypothetical protein
MDNTAQHFDMYKTCAGFSIQPFLILQCQRRRKHTMMKWTIIFVSLAGLLASCEYEQADKLAAVKPGVYKGQFIRSSPYAKFSPAQVTIEFTGDRFTGQSDVIKYPAICSGTFRVEGNEIIFNNECFFTADFDWTLILQGNYQYQVKDNQLEITRIQNEVTDRYVLVRQ